MFGGCCKASQSLHNLCPSAWWRTNHVNITAVSEIGVRARFSRGNSENAEIHGLNPRLMYFTKNASTVSRMYTTARINLNHEHTASFDRERFQSSSDAEVTSTRLPSTLQAAFHLSFASAGFHMYPCSFLEHLGSPEVQG